MIAQHCECIKCHECDTCVNFMFVYFSTYMCTHARAHLWTCADRQTDTHTYTRTEFPGNINDKPKLGLNEPVLPFLR